MVDFTKRLAKTALDKPVIPADIYARLDRASDKGPLRPAQTVLLDLWHRECRSRRDVILKLHTGQGKTLVGLLMLQSKLHENEGRALYLCPNRFLVRQTLSQARQFGVPCVSAPGDLPTDFLDGKSICVTTVQKVFNGLSRFGLGAQSLPVDYLVVDDAHACVDAIKDSFVVRLQREHPAYVALFELFGPALEEQGMGSYADIARGEYGALLPVPYWDWAERQHEVTSILAEHAETDAIKYTWPLLKDTLRECLCVATGRSLEIAPYLPPLHLFGSYDRAKHRVFMSATVTDDSFLIKGLGLEEATVRNPLVDPTETWSGEKMVLIPALVDDAIRDADVVEVFAKPRHKRPYGVVVLAPSFRGSEDWRSAGAVVATKEDLDDHIEQLRTGPRDETAVIVNRYDGIDLPDDACRVLILDGKPFAEGLVDRYVEGCRPGSEVIAAKTARIIEQGLGRAVRGEKDYCVILIVGADLIRAVRTKEARAYFSEQTRTQVEIGLEVVEMAKQEVEEGTLAMRVLTRLVRQCLDRDQGWKEFYVEKMDGAVSAPSAPKVLDIFSAELRAERKHREGAQDEAVKILQDLIDNHVTQDTERGWYVQEMARYTFANSKASANDLQVSAHRRNRYLLKPKQGMQVTTIAVVSQKRVESIIEWIRDFGSYNQLMLAVDEMLRNLTFGVRAEAFEKAFDDLAPALGFAGQRPDREWKAGPDNLWALRDNEYLLVECKNEVSLTRDEINKHETGQMNNACAWFTRHYPGVLVTNIMIIPTKKLGNAAGFNEPVRIMRKHSLDKLTRNMRAFFQEFRGLDFGSISANAVQQLLKTHQLSVDQLTGEYSESPKHVAAGTAHAR